MRPSTASALPTVDILLVTCQSKRWLPGFLDNLRQCHYPADRVRLIVVDNASTDGTVAELRQAAASLPWPVEIIATSTNSGFAGGQRLALACARAEYVLVINPDTALAPDALDWLVRILETDRSAAIAEARQTPREHPKYFDPFSRETSWASGACMLVRLAALRAVGGFDRRFFMYVEDVDLSWRMWRAGWKCLYVPEAVVWHCTEDLDERRRPAGQHFYSMRNGALMRWLHGSPAEIILQYAAMLRLVLASRVPAWHRWGTCRAMVASLRHVPAALRRRRKAKKSGPHPWISFNGWEYGRHTRDIQFWAAPSGRPATAAVDPPTVKRCGVSIIIPTHNRAALLRRVVARLLAQQGAPAVEVIVVDSRSTDETPATLAELGRDPRVRHRRCARPGAAAARNTGTDLARANLLVFLDDDILVDDRFIARLWAAHQEQPGRVLLARITAPWDGLVDPFLRYLLEAEEVNSYQFTDPEDVPGDYFYTGCVAVPRAALQGIRFDETFTGYGCEDIDLGLRLLRDGVRMRFCADLVVWHEYFPDFPTFCGKRYQAGQALAHMLERRPALASRFRFHPLLPRYHFLIAAALVLAWPLAKLAELWERLRRVPGPLNRLLFHWYRTAVRVQMYRGFRAGSAARGATGLSKGAS